METAREMSLAQKSGKVSAFNHAVSHLDSGMSELKSSLASAECPPKSGGQAALNMCLIKQQLGQAAVIKQGDTSSKSLAALRSALKSTEQTGRQLDRSDARLRQDIDKAQAQLRLHAAWGEQVLKEQGDFARLAAAYLPGKQSRDLTKVILALLLLVVFMLCVHLQSHCCCLCSLCISIMWLSCLQGKLVPMRRELEWQVGIERRRHEY